MKQALIGGRGGGGGECGAIVPVLVRLLRLVMLRRVLRFWIVSAWLPPHSAAQYILAIAATLSVQSVDGRLEMIGTHTPSTSRF